MYVLKEIKASKLGSILFVMSMVISLLCISVGLNMILNELNYTNEYNKFAEKNSIVSISFNEKVKLEEVIPIAKELAKDKYEVNLPKVRLEMEEKVGYLIGVMNKIEDLKVIEGREFASDELDSDYKKIIIGSNYTDKTYLYNNKKYIDIFDESYEVVGVVGNRYGGSSFHDFNVYIPYKALPKKVLQIKTDMAQLTVGSMEIKIDKEFEEKNDIYNLEVENINKLNFIDNVTKSYSDFLNYIAILIIFVICNTLILIMSWINSRKKKIGIKMVLGYSVKKVIVELIKELGVLVLISNIISAGTYNCLTPIISKIFFIRVGMSPSNFILGIGISFIICIGVAILQLVMIYKTNINSMMKG